MKPKSRLGRQRRWNFEVLEDRLTPTQATGAFLVDASPKGIIEHTDQKVFVQFDTPGSSGSESQASISIHLVLDQSLPVPVSVTYHLEPIYAGDPPLDGLDDSQTVTATPGKDVTGVKGTVTFQPGQTIADFPIKNR